MVVLVSPIPRMDEPKLKYFLLKTMIESPTPLWQIGRLLADLQHQLLILTPVCH